MDVELISWTKNPVETIYKIWNSSKGVTDEQATEEKMLEVFKKVVAQKIPVAENIDFVFILHDDPISHREQMVRHRIGSVYGDNFGVDIIPDLAKSSWWSECLGGDTKIKLLSGTDVAIKNLVGKSDIDVYSCLKNGQIVFGKGNNVRKTGKNKNVYRVTLDNGKIFDAMLNHPLMLRNGDYKLLNSVTEADSFMSLYFGIDGYGYERILNNKTGKWNLTHRMVFKEKLHRSECIYHADFDKRNNCPYNLKKMDKVEHIKYQAEHINKTDNLPENKVENDREVSEGNKVKMPGSRERIWAKRKNVISVNNHKIVSIEYLGKQDVYNMDVDIFNNFALSAGIFVHNSMRIKNMEDFYYDGDFYIPESIRNNKYALEVYNDVMREISNVYRRMLQMGIPMEDARNVLPLAITMDISWKLNLSAFMHIIGIRTCWILQSSLWFPVIKGMISELRTKVDKVFGELTLPSCFKNGKFVGCVYLHENERRIDGSDELPACPLFIINNCNEGTRQRYIAGLAIAKSKSGVDLYKLMKTKIEEYSNLWQKKITLEV